MREPSSRTADTASASSKLKIQRKDFCDALKQDTNRLFFSRECWYCQFGDFGILTEHPMEIGTCKYQA